MFNADFAARAEAYEARLLAAHLDSLDCDEEEDDDLDTDEVVCKHLNGPECEDCQG